LEGFKIEVEFLKQRAYKILQNAKTHWISMLFLAKQILEKYKSLLLYKFDDQATNSTSNFNFEALI